MGACTSYCVCLLPASAQQLLYLIAYLLAWFLVLWCIPLEPGPPSPSAFSDTPSLPAEIQQHYQVHIHEQSIKEMLRKARQQQQHNRKAKQHNTTHPKQSFFKEKLAASGGIRTHKLYMPYYYVHVCTAVLGMFFNVNVLSM